MMQVNPYPYVAGQTGIPVATAQNPTQASGYLNGMAVNQTQDQQQLMAAYALQQQQYLLAQQQAAQAQATGQTTGQVAANPYAGYAQNTAALQQYQQMYQAQMLQAQQAQATTTGVPSDSTKKDGTQASPVTGQVPGLQQGAAAYQYTTNPYYLQQQQMLAGQQPTIAGQTAVTPQVATTPVVPGQVVANTTNATLPSQENWTVPAQTATPNPATAPDQADAPLIGKRAAPTEDTPALVQDTTIKEVKEE